MTICKYKEIHCSFTSYATLTPDSIAPCIHPCVNVVCSPAKCTFPDGGVIYGNNSSSWPGSKAVNAPQRIRIFTPAKKMFQ